MSIEWNPSLSVGIDEIDRQQRDLYAAAQRVVAAARADDRQLEKVVLALLDCARAQFATEERWLRAASAPTFVRHAHEHHRFVQDLAAVAEHLARGDRAAVDALDLARFIPSWLSSHVARSDRDLAQLARAGAATA